MARGWGDTDHNHYEYAAERHGHAWKDLHGVAEDDHGHTWRDLDGIARDDHHHDRQYPSKDDLDCLFERVKALDGTVSLLASGPVHDIGAQVDELGQHRAHQAELIDALLRRVGELEQDRAAIIRRMRLLEDAAALTPPAAALTNLDPPPFLPVTRLGDRLPVRLDELDDHDPKEP